MDDPSIEFEDISVKPKQRNFKKIHKKIVCRYWLINRCLKGDSCEFLHKYESDKMPECRKGSACADPSCVLQHLSKDTKKECANYTNGFCSFGYSCPFRHNIVDFPPNISMLWLSEDPTKAWIEERKRTQKSFRSAPCPYWKSDGWCPYFEICAFAHL